MHLLRRTLKINAQRIIDTPPLYFQLASCICTVYFQKTDSMHSLSILRYLISVSAVIARFLKKMRKILKKFCAQVGRQPLKVFLMRLPWGSDNGSERI